MTTTTEQTSTEAAETEETTQQENTQNAPDTEEHTKPQNAPDEETSSASDDQENSDPDAPSEEQQEGSKASRQAARYRRQLRETETERDTLRDQVDTLRRAIAEEALSGVLAKPSSLWLTGVSASDFYNAEGNLDTEALRAAAESAASDHGLQSHKRFQGSADGGARTSVEVPRRFADMLSP